MEYFNIIVTFMSANVTKKAAVEFATTAQIGMVYFSYCSVLLKFHLFAHCYLQF